ncbi:unnamed protein product, partial [Polarella glacialis]
MKQAMTGGAAWLLGSILTSFPRATSGNELCWDDGHKSFERCCRAAGGLAPEQCWTAASFNEHFCCHQLPAGYAECLEGFEGKVLAKLGRLEPELALALASGLEYADHALVLSQVLDLYRHMLSVQPLKLWTLACASPRSPWLWSDGCECCDPAELDNCEAGEAAAAQAATKYSQCCYPVYARQVRQPPDEPLEAEIQRHLGSIQVQPGRIAEGVSTTRWRVSQYLHAGACVISIRGRRVESCKEDLACPGFDCSYLRALLQTVAIVHEINPLPDMDFVLNAADATISHFGELPVFTRAGTRWTNTLALPSEWQLHPHQCRMQVEKAFHAGAAVPWEERAPRLIWRGSRSNCRMPDCDIAAADDDAQAMEKCGRLAEGRWRECQWNFTTWLKMPRGRLVWMGRFNPAIDAKLVLGRFENRFQKFPLDAEFEAFLRSEDLISEPVTLEEQARFKYAIAVEGDSAPDRVFWQLFTGSVVIIPDGPWKDMLSVLGPEPFVHFVPVRYDLGD